MRQINCFLFILICVGMTLLPFLFSATLQAQETSDTELQLEEAAICRNVVDRAPIGRGSVFHTDTERLYCFTKVVGAKTDTTIIHHWYLNGKLKASVTLPVKLSIVAHLEFKRDHTQRRRRLDGGSADSGWQCHRKHPLSCAMIEAFKYGGLTFLAYLLGSIPFGLVLAFLFSKQDIRQ